MFSHELGECLPGCATLPVRSPIIGGILGHLPTPAQLVRCTAWEAIHRRSKQPNQLYANFARLEHDSYSYNAPAD